MQLGKGSSLKLLMTVVLGVGGLCLLLSSLPMDSSPLSSAAWPAAYAQISSAAWPAAYAQTPLTVTLDGLGDDWTDPAWRLITDTLDVTVAGDPNCGGSPDRPHDAPCFARTGYDITAIWGYYRVLDDSWYFRLDVDGVPGDSDSITGTNATALGYGTSGHDSGALHEGNDLDPDGVGSVGGMAEKYILRFGPAEGTVTELAQLLDDQGPGQVFTLRSPPESTVSGEAVYSTTVDPGIIEWRIDKTSLLGALGAPSELWMRVFADSDLDRLGEDSINVFLVLGIDIANICPTPFLVGAEATFPISYSIISTSTYPLASNVTITAPVPAGTTYVGCSGDGCLESGGVISWSLGTLPRGTEGVVYFNAVANVDTGITTEAFISIAEGLSDETSATGCTAVQPPPTSTPTPTSTATPVPPPPEDEDEDEKPPPPPPPPIPTFTPMPSPTASPTPVFPSYLPETGESAKDVFWLGLALLVGALLGSGILLRRQL